MNNNSINEILEWIDKKNKEIHVAIKKNRLEDSDFWFYDENEGSIVNKNRSFFAIKGIQKIDGGEVVAEPFIQCLMPECYQTHLANYTRNIILQ